jgi:hypothetical protein
MAVSSVARRFFICLNLSLAAHPRLAAGPHLATDSQGDSDDNVESENKKQVTGHMASIYISSTFGDLKDYRSAVNDILRKAGHDVKAMEDYVATDQRPAEKCVADVASADLYLGIFAWRYGYVPEEYEDKPNTLSVTELEYRGAIDHRKHCLIFLVEEDAPWSGTAMDSNSGENNSGTRIKRLKQKVAKQHLASFFKSPDHLAKLASAAVANWERENTQHKNDGIGEGTHATELTQADLAKYCRGRVDEWSG